MKLLLPLLFMKPQRGATMVEYAVAGSAYHSRRCFPDFHFGQSD